MDIEKAKTSLHDLTTQTGLCWKELKVLLKELEKKDLIINEMAEYISLLTDELVSETGTNNLKCCESKKCLDDGNLECKDCIKEYFTNKAENVGE